MDNNYLNPNTSIDMYSGNPDLTGGVDYTKITLDTLGVTIDTIKGELLGMNNDLKDPKTGEPYPDSFYQDMIYLATSEVEKRFDIVIRPRLVYDRLDYHRNDFNAYVLSNTSCRPILHVDNFKLYWNNQDILDMPNEWVKVTNRMGEVQVSPSVLMQGFNASVNPTVFPLFQTPYSMNPAPYTSTEYSPQMIGLAYVAGMMPQPEDQMGINRDWYIQPDVVRYIAKQAAIEVLERFGRNILGPGIASYSVSVDDMSSSINSTQSAEHSATSGEIITLQQDMKDLEAGIRNFYGGYNIGYFN